MMKKILTLTAAALLCLAAFRPALAAGGGLYALDEVGVEITMPANLLVFTRDVTEDDPDLALIEMTRGELLDIMEEQEIYLNALEENGEYEIVLTVSKSPVVSMSGLSEEEFRQSMEEMEKGFADVGAKLTGCVEYGHGQSRFLELRFDYTEDNYTTFGLQYYTIYNNRAVNVTLHSYLGEITRAQEAVMKTVVDGMRFTEEPKKQTFGGGALLNITGVGSLDSVLSFAIVLLALMVPVLVFRRVTKNTPIPTRTVTILGIAYALAAIAAVVVIAVKTGRGGSLIGAAVTGGMFEIIKLFANGKKAKAAQAPAFAGDAGARETSAPPEAYSARLDARLSSLGGKDGDNNGKSGKNAARFCGVCGGELLPGTVFCGNCGTRVPEEGNSK